MPDMRKTQVVYECDVCGSEDETTVTVGFTGEVPWKVDLCPEHAQPIRDFQGRSAPSGKPRRPPTRIKTTKKGGGPKATDYKITLS